MLAFNLFLLMALYIYETDEDKRFKNSLIKDIQRQCPQDNKLLIKVYVELTVPISLFILDITAIISYIKLYISNIILKIIVKIMQYLKK